MQNETAQKKRSIFHWHRQIGLVVSVFVVALSITGILLNHTEDLELDSKHVKSEFLLKWYGIKNPVIDSYPVGKNWVSHVGDKIYFNNVLAEKEIAQITGTVKLKNITAVATQNEIILLTHDGEKIERLDASTGVPANITSIGLSDLNTLVLKTNTSIFQANDDISEWKKSNSENITWSRASRLPIDLENTLNELFRGKGLTKERVLLDIHSGRILGKAGPLIMDLSAILLIILSLTGIWMYTKRYWAKRKRNKLLNAASVGDAYSAADLKRGEEGIVLTVIGGEALRQRLASMGIMAGTVIATPASSVFNDPRTYLVRGYQLCMRTTEATMILLETDADTIHRLENSSKECLIEPTVNDESKST